MLKIDKNMNDAVDYVAFEVERISNVEISCEHDQCYTINLEVKLYGNEELDEIGRIIQNWNVRQIYK